MKLPDDRLVTPIYVKTRSDMPWPEDEKVFYQLTADGLFLCRNNEFFRSSVPVSNWPPELAPHRAFLQLRYPKLPRRLLELAVGFAARIGEMHGSEAGLLIAWDRKASCLRLVVPRQTATVGRNWFGEVYPIGLHYEVPTNLPAEWSIIGDIHSHVDEAAYSSATDRYDEIYRAGLHIVIGRIRREPPQFHIEAVVEGTRFEVDPALVFEGYGKRRLSVPQKWLARVKVEPSRPTYSGRDSGGWSISRRDSQISDSYGRTAVFRDSDAPLPAKDQGTPPGPESPAVQPPQPDDSQEELNWEIEEKNDEF